VQEVGYKATCIFVVESALCLLEERERLAVRRGVVTPGAAFSRTSLVERLTRHGIVISRL
jgi:short subunit dehydrogenase-like uncharacterized protein